MGPLVRGLADICRANGIEPTVVQTWIKRGFPILGEHDLDSSGSGSHRMVVFETAMQVSVALAATRSGVGVRPALRIGMSFVGSGGNTFRIRRGEGGRIETDTTPREPCAIFPAPARTLMVLSRDGWAFVEENPPGCASSLLLSAAPDLGERMANAFTVVDLGFIWRRVAELYGR